MNVLWSFAMCSRQDGRVEFQGNVEIRTKPNAEVQRPGSGDATDMMATAPLVLAAQDAHSESDRRLKVSAAAISRKNTRFRA